MAYGDVKEHFSKGELNDLWNFIEFVGEISHLSETISKN